MKPAAVDGMDVLRPRRRLIAAPLKIVLLVLLLAAAAVGSFATLVHGTVAGAPSIDRATIITGSVSQKTLLRSIVAAGTLESQDVHVVAAEEAGVVEQVLVKPGAFVRTGSPVALMSNPDIDASVESANAAVNYVRAQLRSAKEIGREAVLAQRSAYSSAEAQSSEDRTYFEGLRSLVASGNVADQTFRLAAIKSRHSDSELLIARAQLSVVAAEQAAKVAEVRAQLDQANATLQAKEVEKAELVVKARADGVVQSVAVDPGARVDAGAQIARLADQRSLKAVLKVPEGQVHEVTLGMPVRVDTGNGIARGHVARIAPAAQDGSVAVDVTFANKLPVGARPDLNVDGTIDIQMIPNTLSIPRPSGATENTTTNLYVVSRAGSSANLVPVRLGVGSADSIQVVSGLRKNDEVILSDTSGFNNAPTVYLR